MVNLDANRDLLFLLFVGIARMLNSTAAPIKIKSNDTLMVNFNGKLSTGS